MSSLCLNLQNSLTEVEMLRNSLEPALTDARITFWGTRVLKTTNGPAPLWDVARKAVQIAKKHLETQDATLNQRLAGMELAKILHDFVKITDKQIANSNFFTRFLAWAKDQFEELFGGSPGGTAFYIRETGPLTEAPPILAYFWLVAGNKHPIAERSKELTAKWEELGYTPDNRTAEEIERDNHKEENTSEKMGVFGCFLPPFLFWLGKSLH